MIGCCRQVSSLGTGLVQPLAPDLQLQAHMMDKLHVSYEPVQ